MGRRFIVYGLAGWCVEIFWTGMGSLIKGNVKLTGWTYIWMFPIYGGCAVFLELIHDRMRYRPFYVRGGVYTVVIFITEYLTGFLLKLITGVCPWDYSGCLFSINGFIRLDYAPAWFTAGLLFEKLHDFLIGYRAVKRA